MTGTSEAKTPGITRDARRQEQGIGAREMKRRKEQGKRKREDVRMIHGREKERVE